MNITQRKLAYSGFVDVTAGRAPRHRWFTVLCRTLYQILLWAVIAFVAVEAAHGAFSSEGFLTASSPAVTAPVLVPLRLAR